MTAVRSAASQLLAADREVVAVVYSYGGVAGTEAPQGLGKAQEGKTGRVIALVYIAAMVPMKGHSSAAHLESIGDFTLKTLLETLVVICRTSLYLYTMKCHLATLIT